jgi:hypothetical protein
MRRNDKVGKRADNEIRVSLYCFNGKAAKSKQ